MVRPWSNSFRFIDNWRPYTYHAVLLSWVQVTLTTFFNFYFRWGFVENWKAWSNSLTNTMIFFFLYVSGGDSHFDMFSGRILRRVTWTSGPCLPAPAKWVLFWLSHVKLYYHANQIWHVCNNLFDAMVQVPYGNCFSWLKKNSQTLRQERPLQQPMVNNETIMLSECATLLRDIRFGIRILVKKVASVFFHSWLVSFSPFPFFYRQEKDVGHWHYQQFKMYERITVSKNCKERTSSLIICFVLLAFSVKNWVG